MSAEKRISTAQIGLHCPLRPENYQTGRLSLSLSPPLPLFVNVLLRCFVRIQHSFVRREKSYENLSFLVCGLTAFADVRAINLPFKSVSLLPTRSAYSPFLRIFCLNCSLFAGPPKGQPTVPGHLSENIDSTS